METQDEFEMVVNHIGFSQVVDPTGEHRCPNCRAVYTNEGEGVLCKSCDDGAPAQ